MWWFVAIIGSFALGILIGIGAGRKQAYANFIQLQDNQKRAELFSQNFNLFLNNVKGEKNGE